MDRYKPVCPFCGTWVLGPGAGYFARFADAARALNAHLRFNCAEVPPLSPTQRERMADLNVSVVEDVDAARAR